MENAENPLDTREILFKIQNKKINYAKFEEEKNRIKLRNVVKSQI